MLITRAHILLYMFRVSGDLSRSPYISDMQDVNICIRAVYNSLREMMTGV